MRDGDSGVSKAIREIELDAIPSITRMLGSAAITRKAKQVTPQFLPIRISARAIRADAKRLAKFQDVCGFAATEQLPLPYPHIMAFALHLQLMLEPEFPLTPMGAVHIRNRIRQTRALTINDSMDFTVTLGESRQVPKGFEVDIITEVRVDNELVWDDLSTMLLRHGSSKAKEQTATKAQAQTKSAPPEAPTFDDSVSWQLAANMGRKYAAASGDYNPIHLFLLTARLMGFKRQIVHGMWSKSRSVAYLMPQQYSGPAEVNVWFKLPVFLPSTVNLYYSSTSTGSDFEMRDSNGKKPHMKGSLQLSGGPAQQR
jgi:acyl dehydratase